MLNILLEKAQKLKAELDAMRPLSPDAEGRVMQKLRIDWNYHSNNMEGNSLTYGETRALLLYGMTAKGKPLNDHLEISGHQAAIDWLVEVVKKEAEITEHFIRSLHQIIFGGKFHDSVKVGGYKDTDNFLITKTNETLRFTSPEETPFEMQNLVTKYQQKIAEGNDNPIVLAAAFHYEFVRIHPFEDGNGRMSRLLMNFILMRFGYPPAVIKTEEKESYYTALQLADAEKNSLPLAEYLATAVIHSLELMLKGARGESIEEPSDLDKQLAMLEKELLQKGTKIEKIYSPETVEEWEKDILPILIDKFKEVNQKFARFYKNAEFKLTENKTRGYHYLCVSYYFHNFKIFINSNEFMNYECTFYIRLNHNRYCIDSRDTVLDNYYHVFPTEEQLNTFANKISKPHLELINEYKATNLWKLQ